MERTRIIWALNKRIENNLQYYAPARRRRHELVQFAPRRNSGKRRQLRSSSIIRLLAAGGENMAGVAIARYGQFETGLRALSHHSGHGRQHLSGPAKACYR